MQCFPEEKGREKDGETSEGERGEKERLGQASMALWPVSFVPFVTLVTLFSPRKLLSQMSRRARPLLKTRN